MAIVFIVIWIALSLMNLVQGQIDYAALWAALVVCMLEARKK